MKRSIVAALVLALAGALLTGPAQGREPSPRVVAGRGTAAPAFVAGIGDHAHAGPAARAALDYLRANVARYHVQAGDLRQVAVQRFAGTTTARFAQTYRGVPVFGAQYLVHLRGAGASREVTSVNGDYYTGLTTSTTTGIDALTARGLSLVSLRPLAGARVERHGLTILPRGPGELAYHFTVWGTRFGHSVKQRVLVDAQTGAVALSYNDLQADSAATIHADDAHGKRVALHVTKSAGQFSMVDRSRSMFVPATGKGVVETHDAEGSPDIHPRPANLVTWTGTLPLRYSRDGAVDAHWAAGQVFNWYRTHFARNSIDGNGMSIVSVANASDPGGGGPMANAFWDGTKMVYGNPGGGLYPFSASLDVDAHEMTHGVTQFSVDPKLSLIYLNQSGAVNEATSDYFGNAVQNDVEGITPSDPHWGQLGEGLCRKKFNNFGFPCPLRDLTDPHHQGLPANTSEYIGVLPDFDNGGVHTDSTIYSSALWQMRTALYNTDGGQAGADLADRIVYGAYNYYTPTTDFVAGRNAVVQSATDLQTAGDATAADVAAVNQVFDDHGIVSGWDTDPAKVDSTTLVQNDIATFLFAPNGPKASGPNFVYTDDIDKTPNGRQQVYVNTVDGTGTPQEIGDTSSTTRDEGQPVLSGTQAAWVHLTKGQGLVSKIDGRVVGGPLTTLASQPKSLLVDPSISGNRLVWTRINPSKGFSQDVYTRVIGGPIQRLSTSGGASAPTTNGTWVAWLDFNAKGSPTLKTKNMVTGKVTSVTDQLFSTFGNPALNDTSVFAYEDADGDGTGAIMKWNLGSATAVKLVKATDPNAPKWGGFSPQPPTVAVNATSVVYSTEATFIAWGGGNAHSTNLHDVGRHLFMLSVTGGTPVLVTHNGGDQAFPSMSGDAQQVLWLDGSQGRTDVMTRTTPAG